MVTPTSRAFQSPIIEWHPNFNTASASLEAVRQAGGDINEIRMLLKGNVETCTNLFKQAVAEGDAVSQIELSHAFFGMKWGEDALKDFSSLSAQDLEIFPYHLEEFLFFNALYNQAMGTKADKKTDDARGEETFRKAASQGYLSAVLQLKCKEWRMYTGSYGFAVALRPFVGKGCRQLDYCFGRALKNGSQRGSELYYEGMYWMNQSCGIPVEYPKEHESFIDFTNRYLSYENTISTYAEHDGFCHVGSDVILAPSKQVWDAFVKQKLENVKFAPIESYSFTYNSNQIVELLNEYKIETLHACSFIESTTEGTNAQNFIGETVHGFPIDTLTIYQNNENIGEISVNKNTFKIHQTFKDPKIQPIIDFAQNVMTRTGSAYSAHSWLRQMSGKRI